MEFYDTFADRFQDLSKVNNPAASTAKVLLLLRAFKRKCFRECDAITLTLTWFTWKFMIWYHKILQIIFQKHPSYPRNICPEYGRKLPNLTASSGVFVYLKNIDSVEHM